MERRKITNVPVKGNPLPRDFLKMVDDVFKSNFDAGLQAMNDLRPGSRLQSSGAVFKDEVLLAVTLSHIDALSATTVYASCDFDPKASTPTAQDLLGACVDAAGAIWGQLLDPTNTDGLERLADESLSALKNVPYEWAPTDVERFRVYLKIDKANPELDALADDWLEKNDPDHAERLRRESEETEELFVTGPKSRKPGSSSGGSSGLH